MVGGVVLAWLVSARTRKKERKKKTKKKARKKTEQTNGDERRRK
jgi:hypothetical protein